VTITSLPFEVDTGEIKNGKKKKREGGKKPLYSQEVSHKLKPNNNKKKTLGKIGPTGEVPCRKRAFITG